MTNYSEPHRRSLFLFTATTLSPLLFFSYLPPFPPFPKVVMVKLSLPSWDRDKSKLQAGTSFAPTLAGRFKSSASSTTPTVLRRLKLPDNATTQPTHHPLMTLRLSSPSFLDSVVHDGSSDNPLYVIDTDDNVTKVRRSDPKGFVKVCSVRWPMDPIRSMSRKNKDLVGVEVAFGKGAWKSADDFLGYSYSSLSRFVPPPCVMTI
jgi:hypothetical protein